MGKQLQIFKLNQTPSPSSLPPQGERECRFLIRPRGEKVREFILVEKSVFVDNPNPVL